MSNHTTSTTQPARTVEVVREELEATQLARESLTGQEKAKMTRKVKPLERRSALGR